MGANKAPKQQLKVAQGDETMIGHRCPVSRYIAILEHLVGVRTRNSTGVTEYQYHSTTTTVPLPQYHYHSTTVHLDRSSRQSTETIHLDNPPR